MRYDTIKFEKITFIIGNVYDKQDSSCETLLGEIISKTLSEEIMHCRI